MKSFSFIAFFSLFLTACASNPPSYLPSGSKPIINVEADVAKVAEVKAASDELSVTNQTAQPLNLSYKLFWYDKTGVTQTPHGEETTPWQNLLLAPQQRQSVTLVKPTPESENYRFYLRFKR